VAGTGGPRTVNALRDYEFRKNSDIAKFCTGVDYVCNQVSEAILVAADDLYRALAAGGGFNSKQRAYRATRPLRYTATAIRLAGRSANRAYRAYLRVFGDVTNPERAKRKFDHTK